MSPEEALKLAIKELRWKQSQCLTMAAREIDNKAYREEFTASAERYGEAAELLSLVGEEL